MDARAGAKAHPRTRSFVQLTRLNILHAKACFSFLGEPETITFEKLQKIIN